MSGLTYIHIDCTDISIGFTYICLHIDLLISGPSILCSLSFHSIVFLRRVFQPYKLESIRESPEQRLNTKKKKLDRVLHEREVLSLPAAIVSPPLRSKILPMSLFAENVSRGIPFRPPAVPVRRNEISTSAKEFFNKTLTGVMVS